MSIFAKVAENASLRIGLSIEEIKDMNPSNLRKFLEQKSQKNIQFISEFPFIGRGNVLRDRTMSSDEINKEIDLILG